MPLLSNKLYILNKIKKDKKDEESLFCHSLTNEICENEEEFNRKTFLYNQKIWTCRITGQINLTFKEAMKSEQSWAKMLKTSFKKCFEATVLQFVHHSKESLDTLVHKAWTQIHHEFCVNEPVTIKLTTPKEMILKGIVVKVDRSKSNEDKELDNSPSKLNSDASSSDKENIKKKIIPVKKNYFYSVKIFEMDKLVKDIPAETIDRTLRPPPKDQIRMFIRAHAIRHSGKQNFPWVVDDDLVKKYRLPVLEPEFVVDKLKMKELSHMTEIQMYDKIREESNQKENGGTCVDLTKSDDENDKMTKSKKSGEVNKTKKKLKQVTLFDIPMTAPQNIPPPKNQIRSPLSSPTRSLPPLAQRLLKLMKDNPNDLAVKQLIFKCCQLFSNQQINKFPDIIKIPIKARKEKLDEKKKIDAMAPEDKDAYMAARRNQLRAQVRERKREENTKLEDIEIEYTKKIPSGTPVIVCDGLNIDQWIRLLSMSEFFRCYKRLLLPTGTVNDNNGVICVNELCSSVVSNNDREHAVLSELVCVLLKTLLQDNRVRNRREMGLGLAELPVTACTAGELLRLVLVMGNDKKDLRNFDEAENDIEEIEDNKESVEDLEESEMLTHNNNKIAGPICEKLQTEEFYELSIEEKISVLELLQSRILELDMVSSFIDEYQREACEAYKKKVSDTKEYNDKLKILRQNKQSMVRTITETNNISSGNILTNDNSEQQLSEEFSQVTRRRQSIEMKLKESEEKERRLENERQIQKLEKEESSYRKSIEQCQKAYLTASNDAKQLMRIQPLGCDRFFRRYWHFSTSPGAVYVEKELGQSNRNFCEPIETEWTMYRTSKEIVEVINSLCEKGIRESSLRTELEAILPKLKEEMEKEEMVPKTSEPLKTMESAERNESFLVRGFKHELRETELSIRSGSLGGVGNYDNWNSLLINAETIDDMRQTLVMVFLGVHERFLNYPLKSSNGRNEFLIAVEQAQTQGRLNVLQSFLDACVCWSKSAKDDKCRVCRKSSDENAMLLCDSCNHAFHTFCLRPPLHDIPDGEWFCPHCKPACRARDNEGHNDSITVTTTVSKSKTRQAGSEQCCVCHVRSSGDQLARCTSCKKCFHAQCHEPSMRQIRRMNWHCSECRWDEVSAHKVKHQQERNSNRSRSSLATDRQEDAESNDEQQEADVKNLTVKKTIKKLPVVTESNGVGVKRKKSYNIQNGRTEEDEEIISGDEEISGNKQSSRPSRKRTRYGQNSEEDSLQILKDKKVLNVSDVEESDQDVENLSNLFSKKTNKKRTSGIIAESNGDVGAVSSKRPRNSANEVTPEKIEKACQSMLKHLMNHKASWPFREPVDPQEVPDYYQIISEPMDLFQMMDKCKKGAYRSGVESLKLFLADISQIFFNAEEYNLPETQIMEMAVILEDFFKSIYSKYNFGVEYSRL